MVGIRRVSALYAVVLLIAASPAAVPTAASGSWGPLEQRILEREKQVDELMRHGRWNLALAILVVVAGGIATALQLPDQQKNRVATAVCGLAAASLTGINSVAFPVGYKEISARTDEARQHLNQARDYIAANPILPDEEGKRAPHIQEIRGHLHRADAALRGSHPGEVASGGLVSWIGEWGSRTAFAAEDHSSAPDWMKELPRSADAIFFIGRGASESLAISRADAIRLVKEEVERYLLDLIGPDYASNTHRLAKLLTESGHVADTYHTMNEVNGRSLYAYYVLFSLPRRAAEDELAAYSTLTGAPVPSGLSGAIKNTESVPSSPYFERRWRAYAAALDLARMKLAESDYASLLAGRTARKEHDYEGAVSALASRIKKTPEWYFGWYNLALAYQKAGNPQRAKAAYKTAIALEPQIGERDASVYNSYGHFLYDRGEYAEAIKQLEAGLEIEPSLSGARFTLGRAQKRIADAGS